MIITSWHSYPKVYALGHKAIAELLMDEVLVEEKIDGSQFSFGRFGGELKCRSRGAILNVDVPEQMFRQAVGVVRGMDLHEGWTYRGEYLQKPKHNTLAYDRIPTNHIILFDINRGEEEYLSYEQKRDEAGRLGLEVVPILHCGRVGDASTLLAFLSTVSILGGQKIEGVVVKNYSRYGLDKKALMGKYVSEAFREVHGGEWRKNNPTSRDVIDRLILTLRTPARWGKAVQHLAERGELTQSPRDIGNLVKEVQKDVFDEEGEMIREELFGRAKPHIQRAVARGLAEWYKEQLLQKQFIEAQREGVAK